MSGGDQAANSRQLRLFMTPREILSEYGPQDEARWLRATERPGEPGVFGPSGSFPPHFVAVQPEALENHPDWFGIIPEFDDPRERAESYKGRWHATRDKHERGEELDWAGGKDASYEPGDPEPDTYGYIEEYHPRSLEDHPDWSVREHYLDAWRVDVEEYKEQMAEEDFPGTIDDYIDKQKREHYEYAKGQHQYDLEDIHDTATWFESDDQFWDRTLAEAKQPTDEVKTESLRLSGDLPDNVVLVTSLTGGGGTYDHVKAMGVESPVPLGLNTEIDIRDNIRPPIMGHEHAVASAHHLSPDTPIPVSYVRNRPAWGSVHKDHSPYEDRLSGGSQEFIDVEDRRRNMASHADDPRNVLSDEDMAELQVLGHQPDPNQLRLF